MKLSINYNPEEIIKNEKGHLELEIKFYSTFDNKLRLATLDGKGRILKRKDLFVGVRGGISVEA